MSRLYVHDSGVELVSVTTVLGILDKPALKQWAVNVALDIVDTGVPTAEARKAWQDVSGTAMDIGSKVHRAIERSVRYNRHLTFTERPHRGEIERAYRAWCKWYDEYKPTYMATEQKVYNMDELYAGTLDGVIKADGKVYVVDYKTSTYQSYEYGMQIAAYGVAAGIQPGYYGMLINLDKHTGEFKTKIYKPHELNDLYIAFSTLLQYYYMSAARRLKNNRRAKERL